MRVLFNWQGRMVCAEFAHVSFVNDLYGGENELVQGLEFYEPGGELFVMEIEKAVAENVLREIAAKGYVNLCSYSDAGQILKPEMLWFNAEENVFE